MTISSTKLKYLMDHLVEKNAKTLVWSGNDQIGLRLSQNPNSKIVTKKGLSSNTIQNLVLIKNTLNVNLA